MRTPDFSHDANSHKGFERPVYARWLDISIITPRNFLKKLIGGYWFIEFYKRFENPHTNGRPALAEQFCLLFCELDNICSFGMDAFHMPLCRDLILK